MIEKKFQTSKGTFVFWISEPIEFSGKHKEIYDVLLKALEEYAAKNNTSVGRSWIQTQQED